MTRNSWMLGVGLLVVAAALSGCAGQFHEIEVETGYKGAARLNPFLALERFLEKMGVEAKQHSSLTDLPNYDTALFLPSEAVGDKTVAERVVVWVEQGGHLIYLHKGGDSIFNDWAKDLEDLLDGLEEEEEDKQEEPEKRDDPPPGTIAAVDPGGDAKGKEESFEEKHPMLAQLGVTLAERDAVTSRVRMGREVLTVRIPSGDGFQLPSNARGSRAVLAGPQNARAYASYVYGEGRVTLLAHGTPWRNRYIGDHDHALLFWNTLQLHLPLGGVWIMRGTSLSFMELLFQFGWMPLLSLAVFLIVWLWRGIPRFGPMLPVPPPSNRAFTSHLAMAGAFLWDRRSVDSLLDPIRHRILRRWHRTHLLDHEAGAGPEVVSALAEATGLSERRVHDAMHVSIVRDANHLIFLLRDLQKLDQVQ